MDDQPESPKPWQKKCAFFFSEIAGLIWEFYIWNRKTTVYMGVIQMRRYREWFAIRPPKKKG